MCALSPQVLSKIALFLTVIGSKLIGEYCIGFTFGSVTKYRRPSLHRTQIYNSIEERDRGEKVPVQVFDNVFSAYACEELVYLSQDHSTRGNDGSSVFVRPPLNDRPLTPIEHAIDSFLSSLGDITQKVEYWSRDEYINIDVHADIDEEQLEDDNELRSPLMAHVLYLEVKDDLRGPTCVFPTKKVGWNASESEEGEEAFADLVTVPAVAGRVLRFPGSAMHSVPRPAHRWLLNRDEERILREEEMDDEGDEFDDVYDDEEEEDDVERAVLLFNTWADNEPKPKGVNGDYISGSLPEGIELSEEDSSAFFQSEEARQLLEWEEEYGMGAEDIRCNPMHQWKPADLKTISNYDNKKGEEIQIGLMGKQNRRLHHKKFVKLPGPLNIIHEALNDTYTPTLIHLGNNDNLNKT